MMTSAFKQLIVYYIGENRVHQQLLNKSGYDRSYKRRVNQVLR